MSTFAKLSQLDDEANQFGFSWENPNQIIRQIFNECEEIKVHLLDEDKKKLQEEIGDLLHAAFSLCLFFKFNPEETLKNSLQKFAERFKLVKKVAQEHGINHLHGQTTEYLMTIWDEAKKRQQSID